MNHNPFARLQKSLILLALIAMFFSAFGGSSASVAFAQENASPDGLSALALVAGVDLQATGIALTAPDTPSAFYIDEDIEVALTFVNNGDAPSGTFDINFAVRPADEVVDTSCGSIDWDYNITDTSIEASTEGALATKTENFTISAGSLAAGRYKLTAWVDGNCEVAETEEDNNILTFIFNVLVAGVDLDAANVKLTPPDGGITPEFYENDDIDISLTLNNNGDTASGTFNIYFAVHADGAVPNTTCGGFNSAEWDYSVQATSIEASTAETLADQYWDITIFANTLTTGNYQVTAFVDSGCDVAETDESNNVFTTTFTVNPAPPFTNGNDNFDDAEEITALPFSDSLDPRGATREATDPKDLDCKPTNDLLDAGLATVWYHYTPPADQNLVLSTVGSGYDTYIVVLKDGSPLEIVDCNDDIDESGNNRQSILPIKLIGGVKYYFLIGQFSVDETSDGVTAQAASDNLTFSIGDAYEISGNVGASNATLTYVDGFTKTVTSDVNGDYSIIVPPNWSGTVTPSKTGVAFAPSSRDYTNVTADQVNQDYVVAVTSTFKSYGPHDGWILESGERTNKGGSLNATEKYFTLGDDKSNRQYRAILSFDTSSLPEGAVIVSATLRIKIRGRIKGTNPFLTHQNIMMDINQGGFSNNTGLQTRDFKVRGSKNNAGQITDTPFSGWYSGSVNAPGLPYINTAGYTQFRLRFRLDDNNDNGIDTINFSSGNAPGGARPQLIITYYLP